METCLFCRIVDREIPAKIVAETEHSLAFWDIAPQAPVHILVIPKKHIGSVNDFELADSTEISDILLLSKEVAAKEGIEKSGYRIVANTGKDAGQAVGHFHFHVLGKRRLNWPPG